jgi:hypothetical protein
VGWGEGRGDKRGVKVSYLLEISSDVLPEGYIMCTCSNTYKSTGCYEILMLCKQPEAEKNKESSDEILTDLALVWRIFHHRCARFNTVLYEYAPIMNCWCFRRLNIRKLKDMCIMSCIYASEDNLKK